jgi:arylsulfatase A-like enzyme
VAGKPRTREGWETWSALYDCTVRYVDEQIARIVARLDESGLGEETWVVICGDHGEELGEHGDISHHFRLYDHNLRVPLLFRRRGYGAKTVDGMTTLLDLAPTLMEMAGEEPDPDWTGQPVLSPAVAARDHVLFETFHGGNCLFDHRPVYMAVRTGRWKYLWKEYLDPADRYSPREHELYDIATDPLERNNLYRADHPAVPEFNRLIQRRMAEIPEIGPHRAAAAFAGGTRRGAAE